MLLYCVYTLAFKTTTTTGLGVEKPFILNYDAFRDS